MYRKILIYAALIIVFSGMVQAGELQGRIIYKSKKTLMNEGEFVHEYTLRIRDGRGVLHTLYIKIQKNSSIHDALMDALSTSREVYAQYYTKGKKKIAVYIVPVDQRSSFEYIGNPEDMVDKFSQVKKKHSVIIGNSGINIAQ